MDIPIITLSDNMRGFGYVKFGWLNQFWIEIVDFLITFGCILLRLKTWYDWQFSKNLNDCCIVIWLWVFGMLNLVDWIPSFMYSSEYVFG